MGKVQDTCDTCKYYNPDIGVVGSCMKLGSTYMYAGKEMYLPVPVERTCEAYDEAFTTTW